MKKMTLQNYVVFRKGKLGHKEVQARVVSAKEPPGSFPIKKDFAAVGSSLIAGYWIPYRSRGVSKGPILGLIQSWNGESRIRKALESLSSVCDQIICLDDGSTDGTVSVMRSFKKVSKIIRRPAQKVPWSHPEPVTRNLLLRAADAVKPIYCLSLDDDEELEDPEAVRELILKMSPPAVHLGVVDLWNREDRARIMLVEGRPRTAGRVWRWRTNASVRSTYLHCGSLPEVPDFWSLPDIRILHWGLFSPAVRKTKHDRYNRLDPGGAMNGMGYRHFISSNNVFPFAKRRKV